MDPAGHLVSAGRTVVHVEHKNGDDDGKSDKNHSEEQVLANEWDNKGRGWYDLCDKEKEDSEGEQHRDAQGDLLTTV